MDSLFKRASEALTVQPDHPTLVQIQQLLKDAMDKIAEVEKKNTELLRVVDAKTLDELHKLAFFDALTGLANRTLLEDRLRQVRASSLRNDKYAALLFLDLDKFKPLNDTYGHKVGDLLLIEVAQRLIGCVRETDTVSRFGGDEFIVVISELDTDISAASLQAKDIAEKIITAISAPYVLNSKEACHPGIAINHSCSCSIGVKMFIDHELSHDDVIKYADTAMYAAKAAGRGNICFHATD